MIERFRVKGKPVLFVDGLELGLQGLGFRIPGGSIDYLLLWNPVPEKHNWNGILFRDLTPQW